MADAKQFDADNAVAESRGALRGAIRGVAVNDAELDAFSHEFVQTFSKVLTAEKGGMSWTDARAHVTFLASVLGTLAEFYAVCAPPKRETVGRKHLVKAFDTVKRDCKMDGPLGSQRYIFCPDTLSY